MHGGRSTDIEFFRHRDIETAEPPVKGYVHSVHVFRHERLRVGASAGISAKLTQASCRSLLRKFRCTTRVQSSRLVAMSAQNSAHIFNMAEGCQPNIGLTYSFLAEGCGLKFEPTYILPHKHTAVLPFRM